MASQPERNILGGGMTMGQNTKKPVSPAPDILLIGGPRGWDKDENNALGAKFDRIGCDCLSILKAGSISDYRTILFWPDERLFDIGTCSEWQAAKTEESDLESPPRSFWEHLDSIRGSNTPNWTTSEASRQQSVSNILSSRRQLYTRVRNALEAQVLSRIIYCRTLARLHDVVTVATNGATVCVLLSPDFSPTFFNSRGALYWLATLLAVRGSEGRVPARASSGARSEDPLESLCQGLFEEALKMRHFVFDLASRDEDARRSEIPKRGKWSDVFYPSAQEEDCAYFDTVYFEEWPAAQRRYQLNVRKQMDDSASTLIFRTGSGAIVVSTAPASLSHLWGISCTPDAAGKTGAKSQVEPEPSDGDGRSGSGTSDSKRVISLPLVMFSEKFKSVTCTNWQPTQENRERAREATGMLRKLYENWTNGNGPMAIAGLLHNRAKASLEAYLDPGGYPQTWKLLDIDSSKKTVRLSSAYRYEAK